MPAMWAVHLDSKEVSITLARLDPTYKVGLTVCILFDALYSFPQFTYMKILSVYVLLVIIYLSIKSTLLANIPSPDLSLVIVFYIATQKVSLEGPLLGFVLGYIEDVFSGGIIGMTSLSLVIIFIAVNMLSKAMSFNTTLGRMVGVGLMGIIKGVLYYIILSFMNPNIPILLPVFLTPLITGLLASPIIQFLSKINASLAFGGKDSPSI
jgi:rod shape-determining protein MreD